MWGSVATGDLLDAPKRGFGSGGFWNTIDEAVDPSVVRQLNPGSCGPACGAMLLRGTGNPAAQSAISLRQGAVMSDDAARLANAMNELAGLLAFGKVDSLTSSRIRVEYSAC